MVDHPLIRAISKDLSLFYLVHRIYGTDFIPGSYKYIRQFIPVYKNAFFGLRAASDKTNHLFRGIRRAMQVTTGFRRLGIKNRTQLFSVLLKHLFPLVGRFG